MTLPEFLLSRIAEDEGAAWSVHGWLCSYALSRDAASGTEGCDCRCPARVFAECEAKRQIVAMGQQVDAEGFHGDYSCPGDLEFWRVLLQLATVYADHPDYQQEWKP